MATLADIRASIQSVILDAHYTDAMINTWINDALQTIAGGVILPSTGDISPPLPDLYAIETLTTDTTDPFIDLPDDYQRNVFYVSDSADFRIHPVNGGDYYSFNLFLNTAIKKDLSLVGMVTTACVKGNKLYYQGIPSAPSDITVQYYRKPAVMTTDSSVPEGLPSHLAKTLLKHWVCKEIFGEGIEDGEDSNGRGYAYHEKKFYEAMETLVRFIGEDAEPSYYGQTRANSWSDF